MRKALGSYWHEVLTAPFYDTKCCFSKPEIRSRTVFTSPIAIAKPYRKHPVTSPVYNFPIHYYPSSDSGTGVPPSPKEILVPDTVLMRRLRRSSGGQASTGGGGRTPYVGRHGSRSEARVPRRLVSASTLSDRRVV